MSDKEQKLEEVTKNFQAFQKLLPSIEQRYIGKFAVLRQKEIVDCFDSMPDAAKYADSLCGSQGNLAGMLKLRSNSKKRPVGKDA